MKNIGSLIRNHRIAEGLTQEELGNQVFVTKQAVSKWETGKTLPDIEMLRKLCVILKISKDEILGGSIEDNTKAKKSYRKLLTVSISLITAFAVAFFGTLTCFLFVLVGPDFLNHHAQSSKTYLSVFFNEELLTADEYDLSSELKFKNYKNGYRSHSGYGEISGTVNIADTYNVEFGFINTNDWHIIHIRLDIETNGEQVICKQTVCYETDNKYYDVLVSEAVTYGNELSVFREDIPY